MAARARKAKKSDGSDGGTDAPGGAGRSIWTGSISFGLLQIPVALHTAESRSEEVMACVLRFGHELKAPAELELPGKHGTVTEHNTEARRAVANDTVDLLELPKRSVGHASANDGVESARRTARKKTAAKTKRAGKKAA